MNSRFPKEIDFKRGMIIQLGESGLLGKNYRMRVVDVRQRKGSFKEIKIYIMEEDRRALSWVSAVYLSKFYEVVEQC
jgi:hypothetical protein